MISNARRRVLGAGFQRVILGDACITFFRTRNGLWGAIKPGALAGFVDGQRVKADLPRRNKPFQAYKKTRTNVVAAVAGRGAELALLYANSSRTLASRPHVTFRIRERVCGLRGDHRPASKHTALPHHGSIIRPTILSSQMTRPHKPLGGRGKVTRTKVVDSEFDREEIVQWPGVDGLTLRSAVQRVMAAPSEIACS
jgi:hypothetical protein